MSTLAGVSVRTLRLYDERWLLMPKRAENGYRIYTEEDAERLQGILLWRACGMPLVRMGELLDENGMDEKEALEEQIAMFEEREQAQHEARKCAERTFGALKKGREIGT